jgi:hypothetical protein
VCSPKSVLGDITHGLSQAGHKIGHGAEDVGHFVGHQLGDVENAFSQVSHVKPIRDLLFAAPAITAAVLAPELLAPTAAAAAGTAEAATAATAADAAVATGADLAAETAVAAPFVEGGTAATAAAETAAATTAATLPEVTISGTPLAASGGADLATTAAAAGAPTAAALAASQTAAAMPEVTIQGTPLDTPMLDPSTLFASAAAGSPLAYTGGAIPGEAPPATGGPMGTEEGDVSSGQPDIVGDQSAGPGWGTSLLDFLKTPRGALTSLGLGSELYGLLNKPGLPGAAKTALGAAGPAVQQAQAMISSGGQGSPLWGQQKGAIDAQIDQQIENMSRAIQQTQQNTSGQGANSAATQAMIADATSKLNVQRQQMYQAALQQNVSNAVAELTGANQTLMGIANLQLQEDQYAEQLANAIGVNSFRLASLWPA